VSLTRLSVEGNIGGIKAKQVGPREKLVELSVRQKRGVAYTNHLGGLPNRPTAQTSLKHLISLIENARTISQQPQGVSHTSLVKPWKSMGFSKSVGDHLRLFREVNLALFSGRRGGFSEV
jgi:hypothetical protein